MDHHGAGVGSQNEAFYDLLKTSKINRNPNFFHRSAGNSIPEYEFGNDSVLPSFEFHQIQSNMATSPPTLPKNVTGVYASASSPSSRADASLSAGGSKAHQASAPPSSYEAPVYGSHEPSNPYDYPSQWQEQGSESQNSAIVAAVDRTMKKYADSILLLLGSLSDQTSQLQSRTQQLDYSVQVLKNSVAHSHDDTHGKLQVLENLIREVQTSMQVLGEKQEIAEAKLQLGKLQFKNDASGSLSSSASSSEELARVVTQGNQSELSLKQHLSASPQQQPTLPQNSVQQQLASPPSSVSYQQPLLPPFPQPLFPPVHQQPQEIVHQISLQQQPIPSAPQQPQVSLPPKQQHLPPQHQPQPIHMQPQAPHVPQGSPLQQQYNQQPDVAPMGSLPPGQYIQGSQPPPPYSANFPQEAPPYMPSKYEVLIERQPSQFQSPPQLPQGPSGAQRYESFPGKPPVHMPPLPPYAPPAQPVPAASYESQPSMAAGGYGTPGYRAPQLSSSPGGARYPRLPTAQPVNTMPNPASASGMPSGNTSVVEVIENVASMGFSREKARSVVRKLTEDGQSVDLNSVLDRLMNGGDSQPQKAWLG